MFLYAVLALVCSSINEGIATLFSLRPRFLEVGLVNLLSGKSEDGVKTLKKILDNPLVQALSRPGHGGDDVADKDEWVDPTRVKQWLKKAPSPAYIPSRTFVSALTGLSTRLQEGLLESENAKANLSDARAKGTQQDVGAALERLEKAAAEVEKSLKAFPNENVRGALLELYRSAGKDAAAFRHATEQWFDDSMERVSGWYKRRVQFILALIAAVIVVLLNADTLTTGRALWRDEAVRAGVVAQAEAVAKQQPSEGEFDELVKNLDVPLGWELSFGDAPTQVPNDLLSWLAKLAGLVVTAAALLLGAPFWFDVLSKFIRVRGTGAPPPVTDSIRRGEGEAARAGPGAIPLARG
jgi:hypothetical protein